MNDHRPHSQWTPPSRRQLFTLVGAAAVLGSSLAACSAQDDVVTDPGPVVKGPGPGGYALDLGGYQGPVPTGSTLRLRVLRAETPPAVNAWYATMYERFSAAYPNISVVEERVPFGSLQEKAQVYIQSGDAPDIIMGRTDLASFYAAGKLAVPLNDYLTPEYLGTLRPSLVESASAQGRLVVMPWEDGIPMIVYNLDLFEKAGVEPPAALAPGNVTEGWSIEDFLTMLGSLKEGLLRINDPSLVALEASTLGNGGPGSNYSGFEGHFIRMMGDPRADQQSDEFRTWAAVDSTGLKASGYLNARGAIDGMRHYQSLFANGFTPKGSVPKQFAGGQAAVGWEAMSLINRYTSSKADELPFRWGATVVPRGRSFHGCTQAEAPLVFSGSRQPAEAVALLSYMCNLENRVTYHSARGSVPARDDVIERLPVYQGEIHRLGIAAAKHFVGAPRTPGWSDYFTAANSAIRNIALGADVSSTLDAAAAQIDSLLRKYR